MPQHYSTKVRCFSVGHGTRNPADILSRPRDSLKSPSVIRVAVGTIITSCSHGEGHSSVSIRYMPSERSDRAPTTACHSSVRGVLQLTGVHSMEDPERPGVNSLEKPVTQESVCNATCPSGTIIRNLTHSEMGGRLTPSESSILKSTMMRRVYSNPGDELQMQPCDTFGGWGKTFFETFLLQPPHVRFPQDDHDKICIF